MTKEETLETLCRVSRPLMYTDNIWTFLIDLQAEISSFCCRTFTILLISQNLARLLSVFMFYKLSDGDCVAFRVI